MNIPALYNFTVNEETVNFFIDKIDEYKQHQSYWIEKDSSSTINGLQTKNILKFEDQEILNVLNELKFYFESVTETSLEYFWVHMVDYDVNGYQELHKHDHNEDLSFILYLNDCDSGDTVFLLNEKRQTSVRINPKKSTGVLFLSTLKHFADVCYTNKKVLVCGLRFK